MESIFQIPSQCCCIILYTPNGRLKLFLFSTLLDKSPLTFIYFTTFEKKRKVRSPLPTQPNFLAFGKYTTHYNIFFSQKYLPHIMESRFVIVVCEGYTFWQLFLRRLYPKLVMVHLYVWTRHTIST